jgi:hypothetical protein
MRHTEKGDCAAACRGVRQIDDGSSGAGFFAFLGDLIEPDSSFPLRL